MSIKLTSRQNIRSGSDMENNRSIREEKTSNRSLFISNTIFNVGANLITQIIGLFVLPLFARNIGVEIYGIWVLSSVVLGYLGLFEMGFGVGITRYISEAYVNKRAKELNDVINTGLLLFLGIGLAICCICIFFNAQILRFFSIAPANIQVARNLLIISGIFAVVFWPMRIIESVFEGLLRYKELSFVRGIKSIGAVSVLLYCVYVGLPIEMIAVIYNSSMLILWLALLIPLKMFVPTYSFNLFLNIGVIKKISSFSFAVFYSRVLSMIALKLDYIIIGIFISMSAITAYTVASRLFYAAYIYLGMLSSVLWATVFNARAVGNHVLIEKMLSQGTKYMACVIAPIAYLGIAVSPSFIRLWMGEAYVQYAIWSQMFMFVLLIGPGLGLASNIAMASGKCSLVNILSSISVAVNLVISVAFIRALGIGGPILGTLIAGVLVSGPFAFPIYCKLIKVDWKKPLLTVYKISLSGFPMFCGFYFLINRLVSINWTNLILFSGIYLLLQYFLSYILFLNRDEKNDLRLLLNFYKT